MNVNRGLLIANISKTCISEANKKWWIKFYRAQRSCFG